MLECVGHDCAQRVTLRYWRERPALVAVKIQFQEPAVAMAKEEAFSSGAAGSRRAGRDAPRGSLPKPEEGLRLVHAFDGVRHPALREAIIKFLEELSTIQKDQS